MKKFWIALVGSTLVTPVVEAQYIREDSYQVYQEPYVARSYGQPNWSYVRAPQNYQRPVYQNAPVAYPYQRQAYQEEDISKIASPVYKRFYATLRAGMGGTFGWDKNENAGKVSNPTGAILSFSLGTYLKPNVRVDAEFAYHTKDTLYSGKDAYLEGKGRYSQYDFGLNAYYDFETDSKIRPFIGIGVWGISSKVTSSIKNVYSDTRDTSESDTNFAISGALGAAYQMNDLWTLEALMRGRYIFSKDIYNLEGFIGSRFRF